MTGMTTIGSTSVSSYSNRTIAIAISGPRNPETSRTSNYVIRIPYSRLSATLQSIGRSGAKILSVTLNGHPAPSPIEPIIERAIQAIEPAIEATTEPTTETTVEPTTEPTIAKPAVTPTSPAATSPAATSPAAQPIAHGHGFRVDSDPKKSKKRKR
jgi:phycocyanin-associated, rod